ncbi:MAG TPA: S26 family signal peptidase [Pseudonocardiaceae bacterium]|nr:S26 family signal peptidase [Pseudonocardiaceae bacterium]
MTIWFLVAFPPTAAALIVLRRHYIIATVVGRSMSPTFTDGDRVLARRQRRYRVGDVIVFRVPGRPVVRGAPVWRIKRVAAVAGDPIPAWLTGGGDRATGTVPVDHLVVVGDNVGSQDSRHLGYIDTATVAGVVVRRQQSRHD